LSIPLPPISTLFPYTTLFRSLDYLYVVSVKTAYDYVQKTVIRKYDLNGNLIWIDEIQDIGDYTYSPHSLSISENNTILITVFRRSEEHTSELQSRENLVCRLL